ncbi:F-box domain [Dillenia turbinata]|uniref:F-box domain n=1 Tax=Dillenia turbinata TaxID=194707 RepID=A0AAN8UK00_9MAGN
MSKLAGFPGGDGFCPVYSNHIDSSLLLSLAPHVDVYLPPRKRSRISGPFLFQGDLFEQPKPVTIDVLPDECLFEIFRRLPAGQERSACASVSKRWLMLLSNICREEFYSNKASPALKSPEASVVKTKEVVPLVNDKKGQVDVSDAVSKVDDEEIENDGFLSRCLKGKKATDVRLASIAVGTCSRGGLGKLLIRGSNSSRGVTDVGLTAIARGCPYLRDLSLWNTPAIGDEGLVEIANGCQQLTKLDLCQCPLISNKALIAIAKNCPSLTALTIESCPLIGNEGLQAVGHFCPNLKVIFIKDCPLVGDQGIASLFSSASYVVSKVKLQGLNISDVSLAVVGHYGKAVTDLVLSGLQNVSERGFWVMANGHGLQKLKSFTITSCGGVTDLGLEAVGRGFPNLKQFCLKKCAFLSDKGLVSFAKAARSLESLQLEECHRISQFGVYGALVNCSLKLKSIALVSCLGFKDVNFQLPMVSPCKSLHSLSIRNCPGIGDATLAVLGKLCPQLHHLDLTGLHGITDAGFLPVLESCEAGLVKVILGGCVNLTDKVISVLARLHGSTLELLNLDGCKKITDASLVALAENCQILLEAAIA